VAEPIIEAKGIRKVYGGVEPVEVLHGIDLTIRAGEFVAVVGQSGSGKSTLLNILGALDRPTEGTVALEGVPFQELESDDLANLRNCKIGFIFQYHYLLDEFTCLENALMPILIRKGVPDPEDVERVTELLRRVGLGHRLGNRPPALSGGEQQRTAVVRALANEPRLVLADEPTGNLDSISGKQVYDLMRSMNRELGIAFVMVTHDDRLAREADRVLRIQDGYLEEA
jgi:lipoprotein-releasing system ATP-binding protein